MVFFRNTPDNTSCQEVLYLRHIAPDVKGTCILYNDWLEDGTLCVLQKKNLTRIHLDRADDGLGIAR